MIFTSPSKNILQSAVETFLPRIADPWAFFLVVIATISLLLLSRIILEGGFGITPGKWLCGIRTLRTTLRPCGVLRALARELMIYVDSMLLFIWLPGILTIAFTKNRQRLGDLVSDTVVVLESQRDATAAE